MNMRDGQESSEQIQRQGPGILPNGRNGHDGNHGYDDFTEFTKELVEHLAVAITFEISKARGFVASEEELTGLCERCTGFIVSSVEAFTEMEMKHQ